jgi:tetratricopeptide (TPR) repeat protein
MDQRSESADVTDDARESPPEERRPAGWLLAVGVAVLAGVGGFYYSWYLSGPDEAEPPRVGMGPEAGGVDPAPARPQPTPGPSPAKAPAPSASADLLLNPAAPRPATTHALVDEAERVVTRLAGEFPKHPDAHELMARVQLYLGNSTEAVKCWERCLAINPGYAYAYQGMGSVAAKRGRHQEAVPLFRQALIHMPTLVDAQIELADALINLGRMEEAITLLERHVKADPASARGHGLLGMAHLHLKDYEKAIASYEAAIRADSKNAAAHLGLVTVYGRLGDKEKQKRYQEKAKGLRSGEREVRARQKSQYDDLDAMCEDVAQTYTDAGGVYRELGNPAAAERLWQRAITLHPKAVSPRQALAWMYRQQGRTDKTIQLLEDLAEIEANKLTYWQEIGRLHAAAGHFDSAEAAFQRMCDTAPNDAAGYVALVELYRDTGRKLPKAVELAQIAAKKDSTAENYILLGAMLERNGDLPGALAALEQAVKLDPDNLKYQQMYELLKEKQP